MLHACGFNCFIELHEAFKQVYKSAAELMPKNETYLLEGVKDAK
jgi:hypothetical protein